MSFGIDITHDIDHVGLKDHLTDFVIPKFILLNLIGLLRKNISMRQFFLVLAEIKKSLIKSDYDTWRCLDEWLRIEREYNIRSTWFVACRPGLSLNYSPRQALPLVERLQAAGLVVGLHSQCRDNPAELVQELEEFRRTYGIKGEVPLRMHYLQSGGHPLPAPFKGMFTYNSSEHIPDVFHSENAFRRPINIMDGQFCCPFRQQYNFTRAQEATIALIHNAKEQDKRVVIDLHQRSLSPSLPCYRQYSIWLLQFCSEFL